MGGNICWGHFLIVFRSVVPSTSLVSSLVHPIIPSKFGNESTPNSSSERDTVCIRIKILLRIYWSNPFRPKSTYNMCCFAHLSHSSNVPFNRPPDFPRSSGFWDALPAGSDARLRLRLRCGGCAVWAARRPPKGLHVQQGQPTIGAIGGQKY